MHDRRITEEPSNAHSLYLETLSEVGIVGFGLLVLFLASFVAAAVTLGSRSRGLDRVHGAAATAAASVWLVHAGIDWDWQMASLTGIGLLLAATVYAPERPPEITSLPTSLAGRT
jgi:hypothetical protein